MLIFTESCIFKNWFLALLKVRFFDFKRNKCTLIFLYCYEMGAYFWISNNLAFSRIVARLLQDFSTILQDCWTLWKLSCRCVIFLFLVLMTSLLAPRAPALTLLGRLFQDCCIERLLQDCCIERLLQDCWNFFHVCYALIARLFRDCCKIVEAALLWIDCSKNVHRKIFSILLRDCYKIVENISRVICPNGKIVPRLLKKSHVLCLF